MHRFKLIFLTLLGLTTFAQIGFSANYFPLQLVNKSKIADDAHVYLFIKAQIDGKTCAMHFDKEGVGSCEVVSADTNLDSFNYTLSQLPSTIKVPQVASGRAYFSIGKPMQLAVNADNPAVLTIPDPDGFKMRDPNYYTLYDKIEFSYTDHGTWINPTAVDFFSLPIAINQPSSTSATTIAGFTSSRAAVLEAADKVMQIAKTTAPSTYATWEHLWINYNGERSDKTTGDTLLRFMAPGKAMEAKPYPEAAANDPFDLNYLQDASLGFEYINALWQYYQSHTLVIDASELQNNPAAPSLKSYTFNGKVNAKNEFVFDNGQGYSVAIKQPQSISFFAGAIGEFNAENNTPKAIIVRQITSAFEVGLLPAPDNTVLDYSYFMKNKSKYYTENPLLAAGNTGPWYDLYSQALHVLGDEEPIYTFAYDDALGQDGTLHDPNVANIGVATITVGDMTGTKIPEPSIDHNHYTLNVILGETASHEYLPLTVLGKTITPGPATQFTDVSAPLSVEFNGQAYQIDLAHPMVSPNNKLSEGIRIDTADDHTFNLVFPAP
tara:strand:+ start:52622 stop:54271 length:1650 start_codon:yes stop_codon:yes gene_type:complete